MWITPTQEYTDKISGSSTTYTRTAMAVLDPGFLAVQDTAVLVVPAEVTVAVHQAAQATRVAVLGTPAVVRTTEDPTVLVVVAWPTVPVPTYTEVFCRSPLTWRPLRRKQSRFEKFASLVSVKSPTSAAAISPLFRSASNNTFVVAR